MISREPHTSTDRPDTGGDTRGEGWPQRLERARQERNHREMARLLLDGADTAMAQADAEIEADEGISDGESLERVQWLLARAQRSLDACGLHPECLTLQCELMERQCRLSRQWARLGHPGQHHVARELVRDQAFEVARRAERTPDLGLRVAVILRAAETLDALGDLGDAHVLRARAFHRLGSANACASAPHLTQGTSLPGGVLRTYQ
jgi:hypothetical protein